MILQHCVNYWSSTVLHHNMEKRFLTGNRASRLLPFEWPASVVILESNALQTVRYNAKIWKKEKKILAARLNASDALLLSKAPLKFKECSDGGYWLHKNAHTRRLVRKAHIWPCQVNLNREWREKWGHFMDLWFLWYDAPTQFPCLLLERNSDCNAQFLRIVRILKTIE